MIKTGLLLLFVIVVVLLMLPCLVSLLQRALQRTAQAIFVAQIQKGGIMGDLGWSEGSECKFDIDLEQIPVYP